MSADDKLQGKEWDMVEKRLERKVARAMSMIKQCEENRERLSVYGYWSLGYYRGILDAVEDCLDYIQELKGGVEE